MNYVGSDQIVRWFGAPCKQPIAPCPMFKTTIPLNKKCHRLFKRLSDIFRTYSVNAWADITEQEPMDSWGYACRQVRGSTTSWSKHAWGIAVDLDADENVRGVPAEQTEIWKKGRRAIIQAEKEGFTWGGRFTTDDAHHFEISVSPRWINARYNRRGEPRRWWKRKLGL